ncbi:unnamed protein product [Strongylus vulgaris]|uniref:C2H2-type domain-containing protein n=1 Tax=Strongylus vulgaris TaxID=40348 RepID=A0A3P7J9I6_STRVU|nr:unnamed protein product [Strongylus vulgaris]
MDLPHEVVYHHHLPVDTTEEDMRMMEDQVEAQMDDIEYGADVSMDGALAEPRAVHQCNICNKIFVSFKGLQQHAVIHTDQKPYQCDICGKSFRFKSNLFEHRSVHTGFTPHSCPYCGKTCRLKGNLKKHLKTHVTSKDELERAWRPFAWLVVTRISLEVLTAAALGVYTIGNRRPAADIPDDAIIVRAIVSHSPVLQFLQRMLDIFCEAAFLFRLKGNLKKHLKTHVTSKDELERAWRPFAWLVVTRIS